MSTSRKGRTVAVVALLMCVATGVAGAQEESVTGPGNRAHLDEAATSEVLDTAKAITADLFSYEYTDLEAHRERFTELTTGELTDRYEEFFGQMSTSAVEQRIVMDSEVVDAAVRLVREDRAQVVVFLDQTVTRTATNQTTAVQAAFLASFTNADGEWKADDIRTFEEK